MTIQRQIPDGFVLSRPSPAMDAELLSLVIANDLSTVGVVDTGLDDIHEWFESPGTDQQRDGWIVRDAAGRLVAWAFIGPWSRGREEDASIYIEPDFVTALAVPLLDLLVGRSAERAAELGHDDHELGSTLSRKEVELERELTARGSAPAKTFAQMRRVLDGSEGHVGEPEGVRITTGIEATDDARMHAFHDVIAEAFGANDPTTYDEWRANLALDADTPYDEWLTAEADGQLVGVLQAVDMSAEGIGWIRKVAVLPDYRGRGIARALLDRAFATSQRKGRTWAALGLNVANANAFKLYESVGMTVVFEVRSWPLTVPASAAVGADH